MDIVIIVARVEHANVTMSSVVNAKKDNVIFTLYTILGIQSLSRTADFCCFVGG